MPHLPPPPAGTVRIVIKGDNEGIDWVNVFWADSSVSGQPTRTQMDTLATSLLGTYQSEFRPMYHVGITISECDVEYQVSADSVIPGVATNPLAGTRSGNALPGQVCQLVSWHSDHDHYRGGHARTYFASPTVTDQANTSSWTTGLVSALSGHAAAWRTAINAYAGAPFTSLTMCMLTRIRDGQPLSTPVLRPIVSSAARAKIATQRRRLS